MTKAEIALNNAALLMAAYADPRHSLGTVEEGAADVLDLADRFLTWLDAHPPTEP